MKLSTLIGECETRHMSGDSSVDIKGISEDSRRVERDFLFVAVNGEKNNGHDFLDQAAEKGAAALMMEEGLKLLNDKETLDKEMKNLEDVYDALPGANQNNVDQYTRDKIAAKKALRASRP